MTRTRILPIPMGSGVNPQDYYTKEEVDALISDFITNTVDDLTNYYLKTETYTQQEIQNLIGQITSFEVVATLPLSDIKTNVIYLVGPTGTGADKYDEYIYSNSTWVKIGETSVDLSNYVTVNQLNTALGFYTPTVQMQGMLDGKQDVLTAGEGITIGTDGTISADIPTLATVATSGSYNDLTDKPAIPVVPTLATVATSGSYNDLTDKPSIPTVGTGVVTFTQGGATIGTFGVNDSTNKTIDIPQGGAMPTLATVATTGSYNDLTDKPTVPTKLSDLTNDYGYATIDYVNYVQQYPDDSAVMKIVKSHNVWITQQQYDALGTNVDNDVIYHIEDETDELPLTFTLDNLSTVTYSFVINNTSNS